MKRAHSDMHEGSLRLDERHASLFCCCKILYEYFVVDGGAVHLIMRF